MFQNISFLITLQISEEILCFLIDFPSREQSAFRRFLEKKLFQLRNDIRSIGKEAKESGLSDNFSLESH